MVVTMTIGVAIGLCSGFFGGAIDFILMRFTDVMLTLPRAAARDGVRRGAAARACCTILIVIGLVSWTQIARVVRAETLSMSQRDFVVGRARARRAVAPR